MAFARPEECLRFSISLCCDGDDVSLTQVWGCHSAWAVCTNFLSNFYEGPCRQHHSDDLLSWLLHCGDTFSAAAVAIHSNNLSSV